MSAPSTTNTGSKSNSYRHYRRLLATDSDYLLRCALTYGWDTICQFCDFLVQEETRIAATAARSCNNDDDDDNNRIYEQNKILVHNQLKARDQYGNSVLQSACYYRPPVVVVQALARARHAWNLNDVWLGQAHDQSTALQVACATGASAAVIQTLLREAALTCEPRKTDFDMMKVWVTQADQQGSTPLSELVVQYTLECRSAMSNPRSLPLEQIVDIAQECQRSPLFQTFWTKVELLIRAASFIEDHATDDFILHGAAAVAQSCPAILTDLILRCYVEEISQPNLKGWWPLHTSIASSCNSDNGHRILRQQQLYFFDCLLRLYPLAATTPVPGSPTRIHSQSPLCLAIVKGHGDWHDHQGNLNHTRARHYINARDDGGSGSGGMLARLWRVSPQSIGHRDASTGLYPFQLAASVRRRPSISQGNTTSQEKEQGLWQLNTIYNLLRVHPLSLLRCRGT